MLLCGFPGMSAGQQRCEMSFIALAGEKGEKEKWEIPPMIEYFRKKSQLKLWVKVGLPLLVVKGTKGDEAMVLTPASLLDSYVWCE